MGKGSKPRPVGKNYGNEYERIFGKRCTKHRKVDCAECSVPKEVYQEPDGRWTFYDETNRPSEFWYATKEEAIANFHQYGEWLNQPKRNEAGQWDGIDPFPQDID